MLRSSAERHFAIIETMPSRVQPKSCNEFSAEARVPGNGLARSERVGNALLDEIARVGLKRAWINFPSLLEQVP